MAGSAQELLYRADIALNWAKSRGRTASAAGTGRGDGSSHGTTATLDQRTTVDIKN
jgi:hypothetical protein